MLTEEIQSFRVPPAVHVGLTEPDRPAGKDAFVESIIMDLDVPGTTPSDFDIGDGEEFFDEIMGFVNGCHKEWCHGFR